MNNTSLSVETYREKGRKEFSVVIVLHDSSTPRVETFNTPWAEPESFVVHRYPHPAGSASTIGERREICCLVLRSKIVVSPFLRNRQSFPSAKLEPASRHLQSFPSAKLPIVVSILNFLLLPSKSAFGWGVSAAVIYYQSVITATLCLEEISGENMPSKSALGWGVSAAVIYYQSVITATVVLGGDFWRKYASCCSFSTLLLLLPEFFMLLRC
nr:hypothetical protein Iba_chr08dCG12770 [Ipomoea batatas]